MISSAPKGKIRRVSISIACACMLGAVYAYSRTPVEEGRWNDAAALQKSNNCYNYATNVPNGTFAQPGMGGMRPLTALTCAELREAAEADGLVYAGDTLATATCGSDCCRVALVVAERRVDTTTTPPRINLPDFHWYREDQDGTWSHKPGGDPAVRFDSADASILDPAHASRDNNLGLRTVPLGDAGATITVEVHLDYNLFCGYYCVCRGAVTLAGSRDAGVIPDMWYGEAGSPVRDPDATAEDVAGDVPRDRSADVRDASVGRGMDATSDLPNSDGAAPQDALPDDTNAHPCILRSRGRAECLGCCETTPGDVRACFEACTRRFP